ncbi:MAG: hypothetical protein EOM41_08175 [Bacilli bacterium]|nr:hypothetical protein [Bacilli bacterium]
MSGEEVVNTVFDLMKVISQNGAREVKRIFLKPDGTLSLEEFSKYVMKKGKDGNLTPDALASLEIENGQLKLPLAAHTSRGFVESGIVSQLGKLVVDIETPGGSAIQVPGFGYTLTKENLVSQSDVSIQFNGGKKLRPVTENGC